ncbi:FecR family protein [Pedobacter sp. ASV1-7]|uniref:FecR family protein n=1 Tax=Pedobacter sp. ASV1-7 TaxID=3145237 RepID=UPI0032E89910
MIHRKGSLAKLFDNVYKHRATRQEKEQVDRWYNQLDLKNGPIFSDEQTEEQVRIRMLANLNRHISGNGKTFRPQRLPVWIRTVAAAALFLIGGTALVTYNIQFKTDGTQFSGHQNDILPGGDKAFLTLSDGTMVALSTAENGQIAVQEGLEVEKTSEGEIIYQTNRIAARNVNVFNSIVTPNGGQYRITLPDGSKALLNAASSLTYPVHFSNRERRIKMTGEVYFEIAKATNSKNKRIPFFIETDKQEIQVLGTHFNVNAYKNESMVKTTLVEGRVKVKSHQGQTVLLKPGQQALLTDQLWVETVDIQQQLAWKNGDFIFKSENLQSVLRQIARWYDIEVVCPEHLETLRMNGMISRSKPLSTIIDMIETTHENKITLTLKGRRLIVTN